jgi:hypothetical protein
MTRFVPLFVLATLSSACIANDPEDAVPEWVTALIQRFEAEPVANPPAYVARYDYAGSRVYYVPPRCCDVAGELRDESGNFICGPDGGLSGRGDGRCPDFFEARQNERIIWRDSRSAAGPRT